MKEYISIGKNVDMAIQEGLNHLGLDREDVDIKILETGGLFKKAKVCLQYEEQVEPIVEMEVQGESEQVEPTVNYDDQIMTLEEIKETKPIPVENEIKQELKVEAVQPIMAKSENTVTLDGLKDRIVAFLKGLLEKSKLQGEVECEISDNNLNFKVTGDNLGKFIGYHGDTLTAIQNLLSALKGKGEGKYRIYLDIAGYKADREQGLIELANRMADKAEEIERNVHLDPMNAYERRIIHSTLQGRTLVETESMGEGEKRHVVIKFKR